MEQNRLLQVLRAGTTEELQRIADAERNKAAAQTAETGKEKRAGRPPVPAEQRRKQYTITLPEGKYAAAVEAAREEGLSFARVVEKALDHYMVCIDDLDAI